MAFIVLVSVYFRLNSMKNFHFDIYYRGTFLSKGGGTHDIHACTLQDKTKLHTNTYCCA